MSPYVDSSGGEDTATNPVRAPTGVATTSSCYWQLHLTQSFDEPIDDTGSSKLRLRAALDSGPWYSNGHVELAAVRGGSRAHRHSYSQERASHEERRYQQFWARLWLSRNGFGQSFRTFALLVLPVVLLVGVGTYFRLIEADIETAWLVVGMNRLRHAYLELAPELEPYFVASHHDDAPGLLKTYSFRSRVGLTHWLSGSPVIVGIITPSAPACWPR